MPFADFEIGPHRRTANSYAVELRYSQPDSDAEIRLAGAQPPMASFDLAALRALAGDPAAMGRALSDAIFAAPALRQARAGAASLDVPLHLRLTIGVSAPELHALPWETLADPEGGAPLLMGEQLLLSRFLSSGDWRPVRPRARGDLRALVVAANPAGLADYGLTPVDAPGELERAAFKAGDTYVMAPLLRAGLGRLIGSPFAGYFLLLRTTGRKSGSISGASSERSGKTGA